MPYIKQAQRDRLDLSITHVNSRLQESGHDAGEVNYVVTKILHKAWSGNPGYLTGAILIGTIICVIFEFYRRIISPYEDAKIEENGDL
jgi:hypothetical protein